MDWEKQGLFYVPDGHRDWARTHASVPLVDKLSEDVWRVYFATRNAGNQCSVSFVDVEAGNPRRVVREHDRPVLSPGRLGTFDDSGVMPSSLVDHEGRKYLYYTGWNVRVSVPYHNLIGLAVSHDGGLTFERCGEGPVFGLTLQEPFFVGTATVIREEGRWRAWYAACTGWEILDGRPEPAYHLKYAESADGIHWDRRGRVAIDYRDETEGGIVRACVLRDARGYRMWFAHRSRQGYREDRRRSYRIGYAQSPDGIDWSRFDAQAGIDVSDAGWDSEMIAYPWVVASGGREYLFYNGNGFGRSGVGYAVRPAIRP